MKKWKDSTQQISASLLFVFVLSTLSACSGSTVAPPSVDEHPNTCAVAPWEQGSALGCPDSTTRTVAVCEPGVTTEFETVALDGYSLVPCTQGVLATVFCCP